MALSNRMRRAWVKFWMGLTTVPSIRSAVTWMAELAVPPYKARRVLAQLSPRGYVATSAALAHSGLKLGKQAFVGDHAVIYRAPGGGDVSIGDQSTLHLGCIVETGQNGKVAIGRDTHIQPRCQLSAYVSSITIGDQVQIAPNCGFYPYDHGMERSLLIKDQPLRSRGDILIEDDAWIGFGVTVLQGVRIGKGAVIGANSVVDADIPAYAIAVGSPAKVIGSRIERPASAIADINNQATLQS